MAEREKLIELKDLQITFGSGKKKFVAVDHVNFDIYKGETFSLVGESGSGKTTIGRAICRSNPTSGGDIYFKSRTSGRDIRLSVFCTANQSARRAAAIGGSRTVDADPVLLREIGRAHV